MQGDKAVLQHSLLALDSRARCLEPARTYGDAGLQPRTTPPGFIPYSIGTKYYIGPITHDQTHTDTKRHINETNGIIGIGLNIVNGIEFIDHRSLMAESITCRVGSDYVCTAHACTHRKANTRSYVKNGHT